MIAFPAISAPVAAPKPAALAAIPMPRLDAGSVLHLIWFDPESVPLAATKGRMAEAPRRFRGATSGPGD